MKITKPVIILLLVLAHVLVAKAQLSGEDVYQKVLGSVFTIKTNKGQGSGFVFRDGMTVVTNYHVISGATQAIAVPADNKNVSYEIAGVIAADVKLDVAVLRIKGTYRRPIDPAINAAHIPQKVYAIGSPLGYEATFTSGNVSGIRDNDIQHTAPISPGSSGGPLLNEYGNILGMNTKQATAGQNLNFAVSLNTIQSVLKNEHKLVSIAQINQIYGTGGQETQVQNTDTESNAFDGVESFYMEFDNCKAVMLRYESLILTYVNYFSKNSNKMEIIKETCKIDQGYIASKQWTKIDCTSPVLISNDQPSGYIPDTFWINSSTKKILMSDTRKDDKGNLVFTDVNSKSLTKKELEEVLASFKSH